MGGLGLCACVFIMAALSDLRRGGGSRLEDEEEAAKILFLIVIVASYSSQAEDQGSTLNSG